MAITNFRGKTLAVAGLVATAALALSACSGGSGSGDAGSGESYKIGISQFVQAPPLDAAVEGFKEAFADEGIEAEFVEQNANGEVPTATTIAQTFANDGLDLVLAVATPSAQAAMQNIADIPVVFTAVTDPVAADIIESSEAPGSNVTGTSDLSPVAEQIALIKEIDPDAEKVGIVYSSGEANSEVLVKLAREAAQADGMEVVEQTVTNAGELQQATEALGDVDAIYTPSDNLVVSGLGSIVGVAEQKGIFIVGADAEHVAGGAVATLGIDYKKLGYQTGEMAIRILQGEDPATMAVETQSEFELTINPAAAERFGVELPQAMVDRAASVVE